MASGVNFGTQQYFGFDPRTLPGCALWLDAADANTITLSGANVTQWKDKSANGYSNTTVSNVTTSGSNGIEFASNGNMVFPNVGWNTYCSVFMVAKVLSGFTMLLQRVSGVTTNYVYSGNWELFYVNQSLSLQDNAVAAGTSVVGSNQTFLLDIGYEGGTVASFYTINGTSRATRFGGTAPANQLQTGDFSIGANYGNCQYYEIILYNGSIPTQQRQQVEGYLAAKWGLIASFPNGHPYKTIRPLMRVFNPTDISGCALWLDAADASTLTLSGSNVTQWSDKSGGSYHFTQATSTRQPTYDATNRQLLFTGNNIQNSAVNQALQNTSIPVAGTAYTIFAVARGNASQPSFTGYNYVMAHANVYPPPRLGFTAVSGNFATFTGTGGAWNDTNANTPNVSVRTSTRILCMVVSGSTLTPFYDGIAMNTKVGTTGSFTGIVIGDGFSTDSGQCWNGSMNEILFYNSALSSSQRQQIEGYLASKWELYSSLPSTHPFYLRRSLPSTSLFVPTQLSTCALWLDFNDLTKIVYSGTTITQVTDKSSGAYVFTPTGSAILDSAQIPGMTTCSLPLIKLTTSSFPWSTKFTLFFVVKSGGNFLFSQQDTNGDPYAGYRNFIWFGNNPMAYINAVFSGSDGVAGVNPTIANNWAIVELAYANSTTLSSLRVNGTARTVTTGTATALATVTTNLWINGNRNYGPGYDTTCFLGEILMYSDSLSTGDITAVEGYLAWKWKLQNLLPTAHPYKKFRT